MVAISFAFSNLLSASGAIIVNAGEGPKSDAWLDKVAWMQVALGLKLVTRKVSSLEMKLTNL